LRGGYTLSSQVWKVLADREMISTRGTERKVAKKLPNLAKSVDVISETFGDFWSEKWTKVCLIWPKGDLFLPLFRDFWSQKCERQQTCTKKLGWPGKTLVLYCCCCTVHTVGAIDSKRLKKFQKVSKNIIPKNIPKINLKT
jgi:hypothetical protein